MGRVSAAHGGKETFFNKLGEKLPLNLNDVHVFQLAEEHGWQAQWLQPKKGPRGRRASAAAAPPAGQQTLTGMISSNASSTTPTTTTTASETPSDAAQTTPTRPSTAAGASSPATVEVQSSPSPTALPFLFAPPEGTTRTTPRVVSSGAAAKAGGHVNQPAPPPARLSVSPVIAQSGPPPAPAAMQGGPPPAPAAMPSGPPPTGPPAAAPAAMPSGPPPAPMSGDGGNVAVESGTTRSKAGAMAPPPPVPQCQICFNPLRDAPHVPTRSTSTAFANGTRSTI